MNIKSVFAGVCLLSLVSCTNKFESAKIDQLSNSCFKIDKTLTCANDTKIKVHADGESIAITDEANNELGLNASNRQKTGELFALTQSVKCTTNGYKSVFVFDGKNDGSPGAVKHSENETDYLLKDNVLTVNRTETEIKYKETTGEEGIDQEPTTTSVSCQ